MPINYQREIDNNPQSQTSPLFGYYLMRELKADCALASALAEDAITVTLVAGHGFAGLDAGETILIYENDHFIQQSTFGKVTGDVITLETPVDIAFTDAAKVVRGNIDLNIDFSSAPKDIAFSVLDGTIPIDINKVLLIFQHSADSDDGKFGGATALTNGVYFRHVNGRRVNLGNYKSNLDFRGRGGSIVYSDKAPSTSYSTTITFDVEAVFGQVLRIYPSQNCKFLGHFRDDLTGNSFFRVSLVGSYTKGEV